MKYNTDAKHLKTFLGVGPIVKKGVQMWIKNNNDHRSIYVVDR